jgi:hypothetical protein
MMVKTEPFDAARYLTSPSSQAELLNLNPAVEFAGSRESLAFSGV